MFIFIFSAFASTSQEETDTLNLFQWKSEDLDYMSKEEKEKEKPKSDDYLAYLEDIFQTEKDKKFEAFKSFFENEQDRIVVLTKWFYQFKEAFTMRFLEIEDPQKYTHKNFLEWAATMRKEIDAKNPMIMATVISKLSEYNKM